jgi:predicted NAD-dependent protein-ADP-ribosyltransferase YbiA (DUF1768 family)
MVSTSYDESSDVDPNDFRHETYEYDVFLKGSRSPVSVVFGKIKTNRVDKKVLYCFAYYVNKQGEASRVGVLEIPSVAASIYTDDNGGFVCEEGTKMPDVLFYSRVNQEYLRSLDEPANVKSALAPITKSAPVPIDDVFTIKTSKTETPSLSIFSTDIHRKHVATLPEETREDAQQIKAAYAVSPSDEWITKFMKNKHYRLHDTGGCLLSAVFHAFNQIGENVSADKLRELLSNAADDEEFRTNLNAYKEYENVITDNERTITKLKDTMNTLKTRNKRTDISTTERHQIVGGAKKTKQDITDVMHDNHKHEHFAKRHPDPNFLSMRGVGTFDKFKDLVKSSKYCPDKWGVPVLERVLNIKFIVLSEDSHKDKSPDGVLVCGEEPDKPLSPNFYIIVSKRKSNYALVSYKDKKILTFSEVPYDVKMLVLNKCMEHNAGDFHQIQDFRNMKSRMNIPNDIHADTDDVNPIVFMFSAASQVDTMPGYGSGERIPKGDVLKFIQLSSVVDWRNKLDDSYTGAPFTLHGKRYASVEHAYQSRKYVNGYPDFADMFSADGAVKELATNPHLAKLAGGKAKHALRPLHVKHIDKDFYGERCIREKYEALKAKFEQNLDLSQMLLSTHPAKLTEFVRGKRPETRHDLMRVRDHLRSKVI